MVGLILLHKVTIIDKDVIIFYTIDRGVRGNVFKLSSFLTVKRLVSANFSQFLLAGLAFSSLFGLAHKESIFQVDIIISRCHNLYPGLFVVLVNVLLRLHQSHIVDVALVLVQICIPVHLWHNIIHLLIICIRLEHKCTVFICFYLN